GGSFYDPQIQALERQLADMQSNPQGMYTPEQIEERRAQNQRDYEFGMLGMLSGDRNLGALGGEMYKQALVGRTPKTTEKGAYDPITGQWTYDPSWQRENLQTRLEKLQNLRSAEQQANLTREDQQAARIQQLIMSGQQAAALKAIAAGAGGGFGGGAQQIGIDPSTNAMVFKHTKNGQLFTYGAGGQPQPYSSGGVAPKGSGPPKPGAEIQRMHIAFGSLKSTIDEYLSALNDFDPRNPLDQVNLIKKAKL